MEAMPQVIHSSYDISLVRGDGVRALLILVLLLFLLFYVGEFSSFCQASLSVFDSLDRGKQDPASPKTSNTRNTSNKMAEAFPLVKKFFDFEMKRELFYDKYVQEAFEAEQSIGAKRVVHDLDSIRHNCLLKDWDLGRKKIDIYQARMNILSAVGRILPRLSVSIDVNLVPINISQLFEGFFGFLIPYNWFVLFQRLKLVEAERYALVDMLLDKYTLGELSYFDAHRYKWDFSIKVFFYRKTLELIKKPEDSENSESVLTWLQTMKSEYINDKVNLKTQLLPELAYQANLVKSHHGRKFDIDYIEAPSMEGKEALDENKFLDRVIKNSLKLESFHRLKKAATLNISSTLNSKIGISEDKSIGVSLGLDTLTDAMIEKAEVDRHSFNIDELESGLKVAFIKAVNQRNIALELYKYQTEEAIPLAKTALNTYLKRMNDNHGIDLDGIFLVMPLQTAYLNLNMALHDYMKAITLINRLLVTPQLKKIDKKFIPTIIQLSAPPKYEAHRRN